MILDHALQFSDNQAITASCTSDNTLDLGSRGGQNLITILATVIESFVCTGDGGTMTISIESAESSDFTNSTVHAKTGEIPITLLQRGYMPLCIALPQGCSDFVRLKYDLDLETNASVTAGSLSASIVVDVPVPF